MKSKIARRNVLKLGAGAVVSVAAAPPLSSSVPNSPDAGQGASISTNSDELLFYAGGRYSKCDAQQKGFCPRGHVSAPKTDSSAK
jgi:hypothetical protein